MSDKTMRVLVTGSEGFIGKHLLEYLRDKAEVIPYDLKLGLDIFNQWALYHYMRESSLVIHLAGCTGVPVSYKTPFDFYKVNTEGAARVFRVACDLGLKVIHASTGEVKIGNSPYAASKIGAEAAADAEIITNGADIVCLRFLNPYGPGQPRKYVIPFFLEKASEGSPLIIHGKGDQRKDYIYVTDLVEAIWLARKLPSGAKVDVGSGKTTSINDIAKIIRKMYSKKIKIKHTKGEERPGEVKDLKGNIEKLFSLGFKPKVSLEEGILKVKESLNLI